MPQQPTLQDVAEKAGVHRSTVSLALRNNPRISLPVRQKVQGIAQELGYRTNPLVTALMRSRRSKRSTKHVVIAYVTNHPTRYGWKPPHHDRPDYFPGASERASELGYKLEHFWLGEPGMNPSRFSDILVNRGINGVLIGRLPPGMSEIQLKWENFSAVALGLTLKTPQLHHVSEDFFASASLAMSKIMEKGYQRIGFLFSDADDNPNSRTGVGDRYLGAYMRHQLFLKPENRIPHCNPYDHHRSDFAQIIPKIKNWLNTWKPDAVLVTDAPPLIYMHEQGHIDLNGPTKFFLLVNDKLHHGFSGIHQDAKKHGALAVDMVVGMLHRGETGVPQEQHHILVPGEWIDTNDAVIDFSKSESALNNLKPYTRPIEALC